MRKQYKATTILTLPPHTKVIRWLELEETEFINLLEVFATRPCYKNGRLQGNGWRFTVVGKEYFVCDRELKAVPEYKVQS